MSGSRIFYACKFRAVKVDISGRFHVTEKNRGKIGILKQLSQKKS